MKSISLAPAGIYFGGGEARSTKGGLVGGSRRGGTGGGAPRTPEKFSKNSKKSIKIYNFSKSFNKISLFFKRF